MEETATRIQELPAGLDLDGGVDDVTGKPFFEHKAVVVLLSALLLVAVCSLLQVLLPLFNVPSDVFPVPTAVARSLGRDLTTSLFYQDIKTTLEEVLLGAAIGVVGGFLIGVLLTQSKLINSVLSPYIVALNAVPKVALAPVLITAVGYGVSSKVVIAAITGFLPVVLNTVVGIKGADHDAADLFRSIGANRWSTLRHLLLPGALPAILAGVEVCLLLSLVGAIVGEFTGASSGLGYIISQRDFNLDQAGVFSALIVLTIIGLILDLLVRLVSSRLTRWQKIGH